MFKPGTVLVIGAGASKELSFPLGSDLARKIHENLKWKSADSEAHGRFADEQAYNLVKRTEEAAEFRAAAETIHRGVQHAVSIDAFIDTHRDRPHVERLGKLQIVLELSRSERASDLFVAGDNIYNRLDFDGADLKSSWLRPFAKILLDGCQASQLDQIGRGLTIICFNYDRCIEQYLITAISDSMGVLPEQAHKVVKNLKIFHPYGTLGPIPISRHTVGHGEVAFGELADPWKMTEGIRTYSEELAERETLSDLHLALSEATNVVFLGFSFAPQNMRLLQPEQAGGPVRRVEFFSTGVGIDPVSHNEIKGRMLRLAGRKQFNKATILDNMSCATALHALTPLLSDPSPYGR